MALIPLQVVRLGRRLAADLMQDACTVTRTLGNLGLNETTGRTVKTTATVYTGPCQVRLPQGQVQSQAVGERTAAIEHVIVKLPVTVTDIRVGDVITITASALDPDLPGRVYKVEGEHHKTYSTARKLACTETLA